ncbi:MAG: alpha/beta hydrolase [Gemmatimonadaceae bacterium]
MSITRRNNIRTSGRGTQPMLFAHGFGCDQNMWRWITPAFEDDYRVVLFDHVGSGLSDLSAYRRDKYADLQGYADDVLEICRELELEHTIFVGHSVSAMIGMLAAIREPARFSRLVLIGPSPCYVNKNGYRGGFEIKDLEELLDFMDSNFLGWAGAVAPKIMGNADRPELPEELTNSFCRTDPEIARHFARVTFMSDNRADLPKVAVPCLILQCSEDIIAPAEVGEYVHRQLPESRLVMMKATGHCPNLSAPQETIEAIKAFL